MVLISVRGQCRQDCWGHVGHGRREHRLVAQVHQSLVSVVVQELLHVLAPTHTVIQGVGVRHLILVQFVQQVEGVLLQLCLTLRGLLRQAALELVTNVVAVHCLVTNNQTNQVSGVGQLRVRRPVHGQIEARVEQEGLQQSGGNLLLQRVVTDVVGQNDLRLLLQVLILRSPAERLVNLLGGGEGREDRGVRLCVHGLHERNVGVHSLFVRGHSVRQQGHGTDSTLDGVQQGQTGEDAHGQLLLFLSQGLPRGHVVAQRHLFRQPEVTGQTVPNLKVLLVLNTVPVDSLDHVVDELHLFAH